MDPHPDGTVTLAGPLDGPLAVVDVLDRDGRARATIPIHRWPVTIGRAVACDVVLDDPFVAAQHATLSEHDGVMQLVVGDTVNGAWLKKRRVPAGERTELAAGDVVQIGSTRLRVRRAVDALAPERAWVPEASVRARTVLLLMLVLSVWNAAEQWLGVDPGGRLIDYLPLLIGAPIALAIWAGFWSVGSKLIRHRFDFWGHARVVLIATLAMSAVALVLPVFAFASGWTWPSRLVPIVEAAIGWSTIAAHIGRILPGRPRVLAAVMTLLFAIGAGLFSIHHYETQDRVFPELYVTTLAPPPLRLARPVSTARFVDEARALKSVLEAHVDDDDRPGRTDD